MAAEKKKSTRSCCESHSCTEPRHVFDYNYQYEDMMYDFFPAAEGYNTMTVDGWWYDFKNRKVILLDSRLYSDQSECEDQKQRLSELNCDSFRFKFPSGDSPANSETIVEQCKSPGRVDTFTEKKLIEFLRYGIENKIGNPLGADDFPIVGPYTDYNSIQWENRPRYARNNQFQQWIRTPPQLCSKHHRCTFFDIDSWLRNKHTKKSAMFEFKFETELPEFYKKKWKFEECMRVTDKHIGDDTVRMLVIISSNGKKIINRNGRVAARVIKRGISEFSADVWGEYIEYDNIEDWSTDVKRLLS